MSPREEAVARWSGIFERFAANAAAAPWLVELRREAFARFSELGFPTTRLEDWKYTNVSRIGGTDWVPGPSRVEGLARESIEEAAFPVFASTAFVFVNGHFSPELSSARIHSGGIEVESLATTLDREPDLVERSLAAVETPKDHAFAALNTAFLADGARVHIGRDATMPAPIHLVFVSVPFGGPTVSHPRVLVTAESGSHATLIEDYVTLGDGPAFTNAVIGVSVGANAELEHVRLQRESAQVCHVSRLGVVQERDSRYASRVITLRGALTRNDLHVRLAGEGAECLLDGLFVGVGRQHVDNHTHVDHAVPHCRSRELYKGILGGRARGVFHGRVVVRPDAQKTDASQQNKNLLLSDGAEVDTKPQLEIYADDVKCSHGSTIGQIDDDSLFYLRSRGLAEDVARALLTRAFATEVIEAIGVRPLQERLGEQLVEILGEGGSR